MPTNYSTKDSDALAAARPANLATGQPTLPGESFNFADPVVVPTEQLWHPVKAIEDILTALAGQTELLQLVLNQFLKERNFEDTPAMVGATVGYTVAYHERRYFYAFCRTAQTLSYSTGGTVVLAANRWQLLSPPRGTVITIVGGSDSAPTLITFRACDVPLDDNSTIQPVAGTVGGSTPNHVITSSGTNGTNLKASAGLLYGFNISNSNAAARYFKLYNEATTPTVGADVPVMTIQIPASSTVVRAYPVGLNFPLGIGYGITTGIADTDTGAVGTDISIDVDYK